MQTIQTIIELFHLLFLRQLEEKLDKKLYALKGGCNLRFFFKSIRYSEDIDFDVATIAKATLENKVNRILSSPNFKKVLQSNGIEILQSNAVKQTETTQRWKLQLSIKNSNLPIPTKIEFSRRSLDEGFACVAVDNDVIAQHNLYPILCNHYERNTAISQKLSALIHRTETQARDVFDLNWLLTHGTVVRLENFSEDEIKTATGNVHNISYTDYKGQVVAYLMDEYKQLYDSPQKWDEMCSKVLKVLKRD
jgi:predicted nucleotidyltransferase component of viral defense system